MDVVSPIYHVGGQGNGKKGGGSGSALISGLFVNTASVLPT